MAATAMRFCGKKTRRSNGVSAAAAPTPLGWALLLVGGGVGGLFAAFGFAISVFSLPWLLAERMDALTAMGTFGRCRSVARSDHQNQ